MFYVEVTDYDKILEDIKEVIENSNLSSCEIVSKIYDLIVKGNKPC